MSEDKSDFRIVGKPSKEGEPPVGLRISKLVRGGDESLYTLLLPGVVPDPLKLSIHPSGEIHLKNRSAGLITRIDKTALIAGLKSGALDSALANFLTPRLGRERAEGFVLRPDLVPGPEVKADLPLRDQNLSLEQLWEGMVKVQIDDSSRLAEAIAMLRAEGLLPQKAVLQLVTESTEKPIVFLSMLDWPASELPDLLPDLLPDEIPLPRTMRAFLESIRLYGGVLFTMPDEDGLRVLAATVGLEGLFDGLRRFTETFDDPDVEAHIEGALGEVLVGLAGPLREIARARPFRPLAPPRRAKAKRPPPPGGWIRRRPRRRGHTAPL